MEEPQNRILIIIGSAPCVQEDIAVALASLHEIDFMLVGLDSVTKYIGQVKYFATYHPAEIQESKERRAKSGGNTDWTIISHQQHESLVNIVIPLAGPSGSSALLGVHAGMQQGYRKIIVCGCPLTGKNDKGQSYEVFQKGWTAKFNEIKDNVRSMSGWTRELLGAPTKEWINA
jgi:hypothetical protein